MNEKLKKLMASINARKQKVKELVAAGKLDEAQTEKDLMTKEQKEFDLLYDLDDGDTDDGDPGTGTPEGKKPAGAGDPDGTPTAPTAKQVGSALVAMIRARLKGKKAPAPAKEASTEA